MSDFMTPQEVSSMTGYSLQALATKRSKKEGFPFYKLGRKVFYKRAEVMQAIEASKIETSDGGSHDTAQ